MSHGSVDSLPLPPAAVEQGGVEVLRAVIVDKGLQVSLRRAFEDPLVWGVLIADVARHAARIFAAETRISEQTALASIRKMFDAELDDPTDHGSTSINS